MKNRIIEFIKYLDIPVSRFEQEIGVSNGYINAMRKGFGANNLEKVLKTYPQLNKDWLLTGEGEMLKDDNKDEKEDDAKSLVTTYEIPLLPLSARGGTLVGFSEQIMRYSCDKIISPIKGADFAIPITGDSMNPEYPSGSIVLIKKINEYSFIQWGAVFVLDTCNGIICKKVMPTDDPNIVECVSLNSAEFPPFKVHLQDVYGMYRVLMLMSNK